MSHDHINPNRFTDSAGVPWSGRAFETNAFADDDGSARPELIAAIAEFQASKNPQKVIEEFRKSRLLIPLVAALGESETGAHGHTVDKSAELSIVTVSTPDGATALPVFSSVEAMSRWNPNARPVPAGAVRVALAAASEGNTRIVLDATSVSEFVFRRPAIAALAQGFEWQAPHLNQELCTLLESAARSIPEILNVEFETADPLSRLQGAELVVALTIIEGLDAAQLNAALESVTSLWAEIQTLNDLVDELKISLKSGN